MRCACHVNRGCQLSSKDKEMETGLPPRRRHLSAHSLHLRRVSLSSRVAGGLLWPYLKGKEILSNSHQFSAFLYWPNNGIDWENPALWHCSLFHPSSWIHIKITDHSWKWIMLSSLQPVLTDHVDVWGIQTPFSPFPNTPFMLKLKPVSPHPYQKGKWYPRL